MAAAIGSRNHARADWPTNISGLKQNGPRQNVNRGPSRKSPQIPCRVAVVNDSYRQKVLVEEETRSKLEMYQQTSCSQETKRIRRQHRKDGFDDISSSTYEVNLFVLSY